MAPAPVQTIDGGPPRPTLLIRSGRRTPARPIPATAPDRLAAGVADVIGPRTEAVWLADRDRLTRSLGSPPIGIERHMRAIAREHGIGMRGFTNTPADAIRGLDAYDEVRDGKPVSTRRPSTHG